MIRLAVCNSTGNMVVHAGKITINDEVFEIWYRHGDYRRGYSSSTRLGTIINKSGQIYSIFQKRGVTGEDTQTVTTNSGAERIEGSSLELKSAPVAKAVTDRAIRPFDPAKKFWEDDRFFGADLAAAYTSVGSDAIDIIDRFLRLIFEPGGEFHGVMLGAESFANHGEIIQLAFFSQHYKFDRTLWRVAYDDAKKMGLPSLVHSKYWGKDVVTKLDIVSEKGVVDYLLMGMSRKDAENMMDKYRADALLRWEKPSSIQAIPAEVMEVAMEGLRAKRQKVSD